MTKRVQELFNLSGQTALVTGGSRGLGLQIAEALGEAGAKVVLTSRNSSDLDAACVHLSKAGIEASWVAGDFLNADQSAKIGEKVLDRVGHVDILVNNAGTTWGCTAEDYPIDAWDKVMNLNLRSVFLMSQYFARESMIPRRSGRILMVASVAALSGMSSGRKAAAYYASKAGLANLTRALAAEWGEYGITVNAIAPGWFPSKMTRGTIDIIGADVIAAQTPIGRLGEDDDLKGAALLFASRASKYTTGQILAIDGGYSVVGR